MHDREECVGLGCVGTAGFRKAWAVLSLLVVSLDGPAACVQGDEKDKLDRSRSESKSSWSSVSSRYSASSPRASLGADVAGVSPVPVQMWQGGAQSRCRCGTGGAQVLLCTRSAERARAHTATAILRVLVALAAAGLVGHNEGRSLE